MRRLSAYLDPMIGLWNRYERRISAIGLIVGFCFDVFFANRPDSVANNLLLLVYLVAAGGLIVILNLRSVLREREEHPDAEPLFLLFVLQICFGGLASNLLVLYGRSGTLVGSALFIGLLLAMLIGNEFLKTRYAQLRFNIAVYYLLLFSYMLIAIPTFITHSVGTGIFLISGVASLLYIAAFLGILYYAVFRGRNRERQLVEVGSVVFGIFLVFNGLYFLHVIPPVPLALKDIGLYHSLAREGGGYSVTYEKPPFWKFWRGTDTVFHTQKGRTAYCFSAVFAPTDLKTPIVHIWEQWEAGEGKWIERSQTSFPINGGRAEGYRGYSKATLSAGFWRCEVETQSGALIGRMTFRASAGTTTKELSTKTL